MDGRNFAMELEDSEEVEPLARERGSSSIHHRGVPRKYRFLVISLIVVFLWAWSSHQNSVRPPNPRREEDRVIYAGAPPPGWNPKLPRQSKDSIHPLIDPPVAVKDPYGWMRDESRSKPEVLEVLLKNNDYTAARTKHLNKLTQTLYEEMKSFLLETSHTFPISEGDYYYYQRTVEGMAYPLHVRAPKALLPTGVVNETRFQAEYLHKHLSEWNGSRQMDVLPNEVVYLDENLLAEDQEYFNIGSIKISPSQKFVAYTVDHHGDEWFELILYRMDTGESVPIMDASDSPLVISGEIEWGATDHTLYYTKSDDAERPYRVFRRTFDDQLLSSEEELLLEELEENYSLSIDKSADKEYLIVTSLSSESNEISYIDLQSEENGLPLVIAKRVQDLLYFVEHFKGNWILVSNTEGSENLQLWKTKVGDSAGWERMVDTDQAPLLDGVPIEGMAAFQHHLVVQGRKNGQMQLWIIRVDEDANVLESQELTWDAEPAFSVDLGVNENFDASSVLVKYQSLTTPMDYILVDLDEPATKRMVIMESKTPGYNKDDYECDRFYVLSRDGRTEIPVSLVYHKSTMETAKSKDSFVPIHLYAYGAYGVNVEDTFSLSRLTLLNRGMMYALVHVRGGGEMGRQWYEDGKLLSKKNTFHDFVDVGRHFVETKGWTTRDLMSCEGRSAGGLTIGAVLNQEPSLFRVAIMNVPFVDLVATMTDASIPLTTGEWDEWGNPNEEYFFDYMMDYSPMNNVQEGVEYPSCLIQAGLFDPRVAYWEPLKYASTLAQKASNGYDRPILLQTNMAAGHFSASDRYKYIASTAFDYSFLLWQLGIDAEY